MTCLGFHVVGQDNGKFFIVWPALPAIWRCADIRIYGPDMTVFFMLVSDNLATDEYLKAPWDEGFYVVEDFIELHGENNWFGSL